MRLSAIVAIFSMAIVLGSAQFASCQSYGPMPTTSCGDACGPTCGPTCNHGCAPFKLCLPLISPKALLGCLHKKVTCGAGCGDEVYWGEWWSDPPKCDPCDCHGNWIGQNPGRICRPGLAGVRYGQRGCGCGACGGSGCTCGNTCGGDCGPDCGCGGHAHSQGTPHYATPQQGEIIYESGPTTTMGRPTYSAPSYETSTYPTSMTTRSGASQRNPRNLGRGSY